jgi:hypothetical protein
VTLRLLVFLTAAAAAATLAAPASSAAPLDDDTDPYLYRTLVDLPDVPPPVWVSQITRARAAAWRCQQRAGLERTRAGLTAAELRRAGFAFRGWTLSHWHRTFDRCQRVLARTIPPTDDWLTAVRHVQRVWPGTAEWLISCSATEGGHGRFVMNTQGSGAGGQMQFMHGTFYGTIYPAIGEAIARGFRIPNTASSWYSPLGQAVAAAYLRYHGRDRGQWTGAGC